MNFKRSIAPLILFIVSLVITFTLLHEYEVLTGILLSFVLAITLDLALRSRATAANLHVVSKELEASEARFRLLNDATFEGIAVIRNEVISDANQVFADMVGYSLEELKGKSTKKFVTAESYERVYPQVVKGSKNAHEVQALRKDGSEFIAEVRSRQVEVAGEKIRLTAMRDISHSKKVEADLQKQTATLQTIQAGYKYLVANASDIIYRTNELGYFTDVNPSACELTGYRAEELQQFRFTDLIVEEQRKNALVFYALQMRQLTTNTYFEFAIQTKAGELVWLGQNVQPIINDQGVIVGYQAVARNITALRKMQEELIATRDQALELARIKSEFLANMSHEIRTPLNGILGMAELVLETEVSPQQEKMLRTVRSSADTLLNIINDILDFSKIEAGQLSLEQIPLDVRTVVEDVFQLLHQRAFAKNLTLSHHIDPAIPTKVLGDPLRLKQVLINLVGNAVKFTSKGEVKVVIAVEGSGDRGLRLRFSVQDTGIGIAEEQRHQLFKAFTQADTSTTRRFGGTGLGLVISQRIIQALGGEIEVQSVLGVGSNFHFTVLFAALAVEEHVVEHRLIETASDTIAANRPVILVVEDNETNQELIQLQLHRLGYQSRIARNGVEAVAAASAVFYPVILMDCQMPEMDGYEATRQIRSRQRAGKRSRIIALTANVMKEDRDKCFEAGMDSYLSKPVTIAKLREMLEETNSTRENILIPTLLEPVLNGELFSEVRHSFETMKEFNVFLQHFHTSVIRKLQQIEQYQRSGDNDLVRGLGHNLKGASRMIGADRLAMLAGQLEQQPVDATIPAKMGRELESFWQAALSYAA